MKISARGGLQPLPRPVRQVWTILHVGLSVGWLGVLVACLTLCVAALGSDTARAAALYEATATLSETYFLPGTLLVLVTGVVLGLGTKWGLLRFYWVLVKLVISLVLLAAANLTVAAKVDAPGPDLVWWFAALVVTTALATVLSIVKPWGRVRRAPARSSPPQPQEQT